MDLLIPVEKDILRVNAEGWMGWVDKTWPVKGSVLFCQGPESTIPFS